MKKLVGLLAVVLGVVGCGVGGSTNYESEMKNEQNPVVALQTNFGEIVLEIYTDEVPQIGGSFVQLAEEGKYDDTIFHRVIDGFMIQGGDYENRNGTGGSAANGGYLDDEIVPGLSNVRGTISMANRGVVNEKGTNGSQFFINQRPEGNAMLDGRHTVFGQVLNGMDVVDAIAKTPTTREKPNTDVVIEKAVVTKAS